MLGLYLAAAAIKQLGLIGDDWSYRGRFEWLIWGECKPHAVIASLSVEGLRRLIESVPSVMSTLRLNSIGEPSDAKGYRRLLMQSGCR